jgi:hypothetical protein
MHGGRLGHAPGRHLRQILVYPAGSREQCKSQDCITFDRCLPTGRDATASCWVQGYSNIYLSCQQGHDAGLLGAGLQVHIVSMSLVNRHLTLAALSAGAARRRHDGSARQLPFWPKASRRLCSLQLAASTRSTINNQIAIQTAVQITQVALRARSVQLSSGHAVTVAQVTSATRVE